MVLPDLHSAAASADLARLRQRWWLNKLRINAYNRDKQTPLHLACINGHADVVQFLVEKKCKLNPRDKLNKSPLMKAVEHQHRDCAAILLEHGANPNHKGASGNTALHLAVMVSSKSLVDLLLEHGADIEAKNKLGYTPLALAITENCEEMAKFLLQKGADVNAQDNVFRTPLTIATVSGNKKAKELLLQHGAVFSESDKGLCQTFTKVVQDDVIANEQIGSSCYETTPVIPLETSSLAESDDGSKEEAAEKEDQNKVYAHIITAQTYRDYKAEGPEKKKDKCRLWNPEPNSEVLDKAAVPVLLPPGMFPEPSVAKGSIKGTWKAAGAAKEEDNGSLCNPKHLGGLIDKVINPVQRPAGKRSRVGERSAAKEHGKGVLQPAGGAAEKEDTDSSLDSETDPKSQGRVWTSVWLPAAKGNRLDARSAKVECGKGVSSAASVEAEKEDGDLSWGSEAFSDIVKKVLGGKRRPAAKRKPVGVRSTAVECGKGVLKQACREGMKEDGVMQPAGGEAKDEDNDSPWDSETDSEGEGKMSAAVQLPTANSNRMDAGSAAVECGKGVLKQSCREGMKEDGVLQPAGGEAKDEDNDSPWDSESDFGGEVSAAVQPPAANSNKLYAGSAAVECGKGVLKQACREEMKEDGVLQPAGGEAKDEDNDSPWDSETDSEGEGKMSAAVQLPTANSNRMDAGSAAVECGKGVLKQACREGMKQDGVLQPAGGEAKDEDNDSPWDSESDFGGEVSAAVQLPAANSNRMDAGSAAVECGKGVLKQACREGMKEDGVLQPAGGEAKDEDNDSPWDSETDSEGEGKMSAAVQLPTANSNRLYVGSAAVECGKGFLKQACREGMKEDGLMQSAGGTAKDEDNDSPWDSETDSEGEGKASANVQLPAAPQNRVGVSSAAVEHIKAARAEQKEHFISSSENKLPALHEDDLRLKVDSSTQTASEQDKQLPALHGDDLQLKIDSSTQTASEQDKQLPALQKEDIQLKVDSSTQTASEQDKQLPALQKEDIQLKVDSSTQTASERDKQLPALQKEDIQLKVDSSTQTASEQDKQLPALQKEDIQLKVDSSTQTDSEQDKQLKYLKEPFHKNDYYAESVKNVLKEKKVLTVLRNLQSCLADCLDSSAAAIPQLEERIRRLQIQRARLEATIQQQAKTIEALEKIQQVSYRSKLLRAFPVRDPQSLVHDSSVDTGLRHCDFPHTIKNCFGEKFAK